MNRFKRASTIIIIAEILIVIVLNVIYLTNVRQSGRFYRVEAKRVARILESDPSLRENPEDLDINENSYS